MLETRQPILRAENVHKTFLLQGAQVQALRGVDLEIFEKEFVAIMGPSGSGKSTLLHLLGGLDGATRGEIYLEGHPLGRLGEAELARLRREKIGFVFQLFDLLPLLTAQQNVEFPLAVAGLPQVNRRARAGELLTELGLSGKRDALPDELSGGQKQRVAIARALANHPRVILADEPTGSLDTLTAREVIDLLRQANRMYETTIVMVTHDADAAARADRIVRLRDGRVVSSESVQ
ncbi:MAG TPA: ABC transporter ATP-binding protein [Anaerolineae bacterium]|nr:ABC transporter ATP-binding protein [Anaerolineae bacterium]